MFVSILLLPARTFPFPLFASSIISVSSSAALPCRLFLSPCPRLTSSKSCFHARIPSPPPRPPTPPWAIFCSHVTVFFFPFHSPPAEPKLAARSPSPFCPHLLVFPSHDLSYIQDFSPAMFVHVHRCGYIKHAISPTAGPRWLYVPLPASWLFEFGGCSSRAK